MLYSTSIRYEFSDWPVAVAVDSSSRKNVDWIDLLPASRLGTWANRERAAIRSVHSTRPILTKIADRM